MENKKNKPLKRGRLSRLLNGENIQEEHKKSPSKEEGNICDKHIDGA